MEEGLDKPCTKPLGNGEGRLKPQYEGISRVKMQTSALFENKVVENHMLVNELEKYENEVKRLEMGINMSIAERG